MRHEIVGNTYYIYDESTEKVIFSVELTDPNEFPNNQVIIHTATEVFAGPVEFVKFDERL
jgi:hypothetical protein